MCKTFGQKIEAKIKTRKLKSTSELREDCKKHVQCLDHQLGGMCNDKTGEVDVKGEHRTPFARRADIPSLGDRWAAVHGPRAGA